MALTKAFAVAMAQALLDQFDCNSDIALKSASADPNLPTIKAWTALHSHVSRFQIYCELCDASGVERIDDFCNPVPFAVDVVDLAAEIRQLASFNRSPVLQEASSVLLKGMVNVPKDEYRFKLLCAVKHLERELSCEVPASDPDPCPDEIGEALHRKMLARLQTAPKDSVLRRRDFEDITGDDKLKSKWLGAYVLRGRLRRNGKKGAGSAYIVV